VFKFLLVASTLVLTGCSTVANFYDSQDPCVTTKYAGSTPQARAANMPRYCGTASNYGTVYHFRDGQIGTPAYVIRR
jgi:hypothetical protein